MVTACSSGTPTNVLPQRNVMPQTQIMAHNPVTVHSHRADLSFSNPFKWNVTLEYTTTQMYVLGKTRPGNPSPSFHTHTSERSIFMMLLWSLPVGSSVERVRLIFSS